MKLNFEEIKSELTVRNIRKKAFYFLEEWSSLLLIFLFLLVSLVNVLVWYRYVEKPSWSEGQKQEYRNSKARGVILNEKAFKDAVEEKEQREIKFRSEVEDQKDIFGLKQ